MQDQVHFLDSDKSLACIHCGLCLGSCPTYLETGNENDSPRGRIYLMRAVQDERLPLAGTAVRHIDLCLGCRACETACPSGVQYGDLLEQTRDHIERHHTRPLFQQFLRRLVIEQLFPFPARFELALLPARWLKRLRIEGWLPSFIRDALSLIPETTSATPLPELTPAAPAEKRGQVGFISGCVMSVMFGDTNAASVKLLNRAGYDVVTPPGQSCCGALYAHSGQLEAARRCARENIELFDQLQLDTIVINAAGCGSTLKEYGHLLQHDPQWAERAVAFSGKVKDLTEVLIQSGLPLPASTTMQFPVTYHDACHLAHPQKITAPPRQLIQAVAGDQFVPLPESDVCCGSAGSYNLTEPDMAKRLQKRKTDNILSTGARTVVTTNPGCILQLKAGLAAANASHIHVLHIADFLLGTERE